MVSVVVAVVNFQPRAVGSFLQFLGFVNRRGRLLLEPSHWDALLIWRLECLLPVRQRESGFHGVGDLA